MRRIGWLCSVILCQVLCQIFCLPAFAVEGVVESIYVAGYDDSNVYRVDPVTGAAILVTTTAVGNPPGSAGLDGIKVANKTTAYTLGWNDGLAYSVNLETGASTPLSNIPIGPIHGPSNLALADSTTAYVVNQSDNNVYRLNLVDGTNQLVTTSGPVPLNALSGIALSGNTAYVVAFGNQDIYAVNLLDGSSTEISTTIPLTLEPTGIGLVGNTAYVTTTTGSAPFITNQVFAVEIPSGVTTLVADITQQAQIFDIGIVNGNIAYTAGSSDNLVYKVDLQTGAYSILTPTPVGIVMPDDGLYGLGLYIVFPFISTQGLSGNLLTFADYLNSNAPLSTIGLFNSLSGSDLTNALKSAMPARLGFATFAAQNGYLAASQTVTDHLHQRRFSHPKGGNTQMAMARTRAEELLADASEDNSSLITARGKKTEQNKACGNQPCVNKGFFTGWLTGFGEYAREKAQRQTPSFNASVGGAVLGLDYNCANDDVVGLGGSYAYTHVSESEGMGHANVNQGFLGFYSTVHAGPVYFDLGTWGGYYHTDNVRHISFPGFRETADSSTHGWQAAPHFEIGYDAFFSQVCRTHWFGASPFLLADWVGSWEHGFTEHGASPLNMHKKGHFSSLLRGEAGLRLHETATFDCGNLIFEEKGSYAYQKMFHTGAITALLVGAPGSFTVTTLTGALNLGVVEFSMIFKPSKRTLPYVELRYQGEFGSRYQSHQGMLELGKDF